MCILPVILLSSSHSRFRSAFLDFLHVVATPPTNRFISLSRLKQSSRLIHRTAELTAQVRLRSGRAISRAYKYGDMRIALVIDVVVVKH